MHGVVFSMLFHVFHMYFECFTWFLCHTGMIPVKHVFHMQWCISKFFSEGAKPKRTKKFLRGTQGAENFQVFSTKNTIFTPFGAEGAENFAKYEREMRGKLNFVHFGAAGAENFGNFCTKCPSISTFCTPSPNLGGGRPPPPPDPPLLHQCPGRPGPQAAQRWSVSFRWGL